MVNPFEQALIQTVCHIGTRGVHPSLRLVTCVATDAAVSEPITRLQVSSVWTAYALRTVSQRAIEFSLHFAAIHLINDTFSYYQRPCSLMAVSLIYVILHHLHARATGMPSWLFKAQQGPKSKWGSPIMVNSMLAFTILAFLGAGGQLGSRYYNYLVFIKGRKPLGYTAAQFTPWVPVFVQAWFFSITNLQATVAARAKLGSRFRGILNPFLHNFVRVASHPLLGFPNNTTLSSQILLGLPVVYVVMILVRLNCLLCKTTLATRVPH